MWGDWGWVSENKVACIVSGMRIWGDRRAWDTRKRLCIKYPSVMVLTKSAPDTGLKVSQMIPPRNSLAVGWVATCTVGSPQ